MPRALKQHTVVTLFQSLKYIKIKLIHSTVLGSLSGVKKSTFCQNRRQKVVNRGGFTFVWVGLRSCRGGLTLKFDKNSTNL